MEIWKPIDGTNGMYEVSDTGKVRSLNYLGHGETRELALCADHKGYLRVRLCMSDGKRVTRKVHRLVAQAFIDNPENKPEVNHKNGDKMCNHAWNLEWASARENTIHAYREGLKEKTRERCREMGKRNGGKHLEAQMTPVIATDIKTGETRRYKSQREAAKETGAQQANIHKVLTGARKSAAGFTFKYE